MSAPPRLRLRPTARPAPTPLGLTSAQAQPTLAALMRAAVVLSTGLAIGAGTCAWWYVLNDHPRGSDFCIMAVAFALVAAPGIIRWPELERLP